MVANIVSKIYSDEFSIAKQNTTESEARVFILGSGDEKKKAQLIKTYAPQKMSINNDKECTHFNGPQGAIWIFCRKSKTASDESDQAWYRDQAGSLLSNLKNQEIKSVEIEFSKTKIDQELGFLLGLNIAAYNFKLQFEKDPFAGLPKIQITKKFSEKFLLDMRGISMAINSARHLANLPANLINPDSMSQLIKKFFAGKKKFKVEIWDVKKLEKEKMGLHLGVGRGSETPPCLVHIQYRPSANKTKPIAVVGKGITFDTGGLDLKPSSAMRLMKKDMSGAAAALGVAIWADLAASPKPLDIYLPLAENSVDGRSMRPGDILIARNGLKVEIHNTDAEGRLVLADAIDVAAEKEPALILDFATLTGACRVALGAEIAGLFSNNQKMAEKMHLAGKQAGDLNWQLPLHKKYSPLMNSSFADLTNAVDGFAGAITAALFLEKFVKEIPWVHLDMYAWADKPHGAFSSAGANGQPIQAAIQFLKSV